MLEKGNVGLNFKVIKFVSAEAVDEKNFGNYLKLTVMVMDDLGNKYNITIPHIYYSDFSLAKEVGDVGTYFVQMVLRNEYDNTTGGKSAFKIEKVEESNK